MKRHGLIFLLLLFAFLSSNAQIFYVSSPRNNSNITVGSNIFRVTLTSSGLSSQLINTCSPDDQFFSIAMNKDGFYWLNGYQIYKGNIVGNNLINCAVLTDAAAYSNALTVGGDGKLYYSTGAVYTTDLNTLKSVKLGNSGYPPLGDLTFYNGELYEAGNGLDKIDINNPPASYIYMPLNLPNVFGLVSVATNLHKNTVYALSTADNRNTDVYEIDIENKKVLGLVGTLPYLILDAASPVEDGNVLGVVINKVNVHQDCNNPTKGIAEVATVLNNETFTYTLNNGITNNTGMFTNLAPGNYQVTVTSSNDAQTAQFTVPVYSLTKPVYNYKVDNQVCDAPGKITFSTSDNGGYQIQLANVTYPLNNVFAGLTTSNKYKFTVLNSQGCIVDTLTLTVPRDKCAIQLDRAAVTQQCDAIHKGIVQVSSKPHTEGYIYRYTFNGITNTTGMFSNISSGNYSVKISSPEDSVNVPFLVPDYKLTQPYISYTTTDPACAALGSIQFAIKDNPALYQIKYGLNIFPYTHIFDQLAAGIYHFTVLTQAGCMVDEYDVQLNYQPCPIKINKISVAPECNVLYAGVITVAAQQILPTITYSYTLGNTVNNSGVFNLLPPGSYQVTVNSSDGGAPQKANIILPDYSLNKPASIIVSENPVCDLTGQIKITVPPDTAKYSISYNGVNYSSGHTFIGLYEGTYHFSVLKKNGCITDAYDVILIREECSPVSFPSAFTPNADGLNDVFRPDPKSKATNFIMQIYDRWGNLIFRSNDLQQGWDGTLKGRPMPMGVFYYYSTFITQEHKPLTLKGSATLIR